MKKAMRAIKAAVQFLLRKRLIEYKPPEDLNVKITNQEVAAEMIKKRIDILRKRLFSAETRGMDGEWINLEIFILEMLLKDKELEISFYNLKISRPVLAPFSYEKARENVLRLAEIIEATDFSLAERG